MRKESLKPGDLVLGVANVEAALVTSLGFIVAVTDDVHAHVGATCACLRRLLIMWLEPTFSLVHECDCNVLCVVEKMKTA